MNYSEKTYEEIFEAALQDSLESGMISHAEDFEDFIANKEDISNYYVMDKSVISQMIAKIYSEGITPTYESAKVEYAEGTDLDDIGATVGVSRPEATYAEVIVTFQLNEAIDTDINIPAGLVLSTENGIEYGTLEPVFIASGDITTTISARSLIAGVGGKIIENTLTIIVDEIGYHLNVNNPNPSKGGNEAYTDDEYRYLIMNHKKINLKGSTEAFEYYLANFNGIESYNLVPNWNGTGTIKCVLDPGTDYQLNKAYTDLQSIVSQCSEDIFMSAPISKYINIYAIVNVDIDQINPYSSVEKSEIQAKIISAIKIFINGGYRVNGEWYSGLGLGEDFIPHKLAVFLDDEIPELKNITFNYPEDYVQIGDEEIGVSNEITIEMM